MAILPTPTQTYNPWNEYQALVNKYNPGSSIPAVKPNWVPPKITPPGGAATGGPGAGALIGSGLGAYGAYELLGGGGAAASAPVVASGASSLSALTPATQAAWNAGATSASNALSSSLAGTEAANAAWNAGATQAGGGLAGATPATSTLGSIAPYAGLAGAGLGAYGLYNALDSGDKKSGALSGAALGGGLAAAAPLVGLGPVGWGALGLAALGGGLGGFGLTSAFGSKNRWKEEQDRVGKLADKGVTGWKELQATYPKLTKGRSIGELVAIEEANKAAGKHNNVDFARTRDIKYLKPEDIWGYSTFGEKFGNDWLGKYTEGQRRGIAQQLLDAGAVTEGRGQIKVDWNKYQPQIADALKAPVTAAPTRSSTSSPGIGKDGKRINYSTKKK